MLSRYALVLAAALAALSAAPAAAANLLELNFYLGGPRFEGVLPPCDSPAALAKISSRFAEKENRFWSPDLSIVAFDKVREVAYYDGPATVKCYQSAAAYIGQDGRRYPCF